MFLAGENVQLFGFHAQNPMALGRTTVGTISVGVWWAWALLAPQGRCWSAMYRLSLFPCHRDKLVTLWLIHQWQNSPTKLRLLCSLNKSCSGNDTESPRHYTILLGSSWTLPHPSLQAKENQLAMAQRQEEPHSEERGRGSLQHAPAILCHLHMAVHSRVARQRSSQTALSMARCAVKKNTWKSLSKPSSSPQHLAVKYSSAGMLFMPSCKLFQV